MQTGRMRITQSWSHRAPISSFWVAVRVEPIFAMEPNVGRIRPRLGQLAWIRAACSSNPLQRTIRQNDRTKPTLSPNSPPAPFNIDLCDTLAKVCSVRQSFGMQASFGPKRGKSPKVGRFRTDVHHTGGETPDFGRDRIRAHSAQIWGTFSQRRPICPGIGKTWVDFDRRWVLLDHMLHGTHTRTVRISFKLGPGPKLAKLCGWGP